jgi:membrane protein insertase Oxa1/YidC/SpoIIIJ
MEELYFSRNINNIEIFILIFLIIIILISIYYSIKNL